MGVYRPKKSQYYWWTYTPPGGKRVREPVDPRTSDLKMARHLFKKLETEMFETNIAPIRRSQKRTIQFVYDQFVIHNQLENKSKATINYYRWMLTKFLETCGNAPISDLNDKMVKDFLIKHPPPSNETSIKLVKCIRILVNFAVKERQILFNPLKFIPKRLRKRPPPRFLDEAEIKRFINAVRKEERLYLPCLIALATGVRPGELARLTWEDIRLDLNCVIVRSTPQTKTQETRSVPLYGEIKRILTRNMGKGKIFARTNFPKAWRRVCKRGGFIRKVYDAETGKTNLVNDIELYTLRHTFASHLVMAGVPLRTVAEYMGHSTEETTLLYSHLTPKHIQGQIKRLPIKLS